MSTAISEFYVSRFRSNVIGTSLSLICLLVLSLLPAHSGYALDWTIQPRLGLGATYTDNIELSADHPEEDYFSEVAPGVRVSSTGGHANVDIDYQVRSYSFAKDHDRDTSFQQLRGTTQLTSLDKRFELNLDAEYSQQMLDARVPVSSSSRAASDNVTDRSLLRVNPIYRENLWSLADLEMALVFDDVQYDEKTISDSHEQDFTLALDSGDRLGRLQWYTNYSDRRTEFDDTDDARFLAYELGFKYALTAKISSFASAGYEDNVFGNNNTASDKKGGIWTAGLSYQPTQQTEFELSTGERFFGRRYAALARHQSGQKNFELNYSETVETSRSRDLLAADLEGLEDLSVSGNDAYVSKLLDVRIERRMAKTTLRLNAINERREFVDIEQVENVDSLAAEMLWKLMPRTSLRIKSRTEDRQFIDDREDRLNVSELGLVRELKHLSSLRIDYVRSELTSTDSTLEYIENALIAFLNLEF